MGYGPDQLGYELGRLLTSESVLRLHEPLAGRTTLRVGGEADCYVEPASEVELGEAVRFCHEYGVPLFLLGRGSNLLVRDGGVRGVVISLAHESFSRIDQDGDHLRCGAGVRLKEVARVARMGGLGGLEFLEGIPGSLGGALRMNAGAMGSWTYDAVVSVRAMDRMGDIREVARADLDVGYRECRLFRDHYALGAVMQGERVAAEVIRERRERFNAQRWTSQPAAASAGCVFKNPTEIPAGRLIEELGLKGRRVGQAVVSDLHGNFIVNEGKATAREVLELIAIVQGEAQAKRGIALETEVQIVGQAEVERTEEAIP